MADRKLLKIIVVLAAALLRIFPHPPNFAPIGGLALFSGARLDKKQAFILPLAAMFVSDLFLGFHSTMIYVYVSFALIVLIGMRLKKIKLANLFLASLSSSILFYLITNFGVWASTNIYAKNFSGLINSYLMGLPFFRNTIFGDLFYTIFFFYGYEYLTIILKRLYFVKK